ncbi:MAG: T9SS type A sorting domain-containing protein [Flavobacteriales bacterium]|nr:T9SS type A sorting domain-containing protein [Flavobacteriales bacterium]
MKRSLITLFLIASSLVSFGQLFSVSVPYKYISKDVTYGMLHEFIQIDNLSGQPLPMRWIGHIGGVLECPNGWGYGVTDPDSAYAVLNDLDSADFILSDTNTTNNKIIISVAHNGIIGNCEVTFDIFALSDPNTVTTIGFNISVTAAPTAVEEVSIRRKGLIYPNPGNGQYQLLEKALSIAVYDANGRLVLSASGNQFDLSDQPNGLYLVQLTTASGEFSTQRLVKE